MAQWCTSWPTSFRTFRGEGPSGEYIVRGASHLNDRFIDGELLPENNSYTLHFHMVGKAKAPNFLVTLNRHWVVDADGTVKVEVDHEVAKCTGD